MNTFAFGAVSRRPEESGRDLACRLVSSQLGPSCGELVAAMLRCSDEKSLKEVERMVPRDEARVGLLLLWRHGLLKVTSVNGVRKYSVSCKACCERLGLLSVASDFEENVSKIIAHLVAEGMAPSKTLADIDDMGFKEAAKLGLIGPPARLAALTAPKKRKISTTEEVVGDHGNPEDLFEVEEDAVLWTLERNIDKAEDLEDTTFLWCLDLFELRRRKLAKECQESAEAKANPVARKVVATLFELGAWRFEEGGDGWLFGKGGTTRLEEDPEKMRHRENGVDYSKIDSAFREMFPLENANLLRSYLEYLRNDAAKFVTDLGGAIYIFNAKNALDDKRHRITRDFLAERYDDASARLHAVLRMHQLIDQSDLAERALMPPKDAREKLYKMFHDGLVDLVDLAAPGGKESHYLWKVDADKTMAVILDDARMTIRNLMVRKDHEIRLNNDDTSEKSTKLDRLDYSMQNIHAKEGSLFQNPPSL